MGWESVPWMVGGGAKHSAEVGRTLAYAATDGNEGTLGPDDLRVVQLATPGASVNVLTGAAVIPCRAANPLYQSYVGRMLLLDNAGIAGTGSTARADMVIARVEDPWLDGEPWPDPAVGQEGVGPYVYTRVLSGVPASAVASYEAARTYLVQQGFSAIPLAGVSQPANNSGGVTQAMITDLRRVANPRRQRSVFTTNPASKISLTSAAMADWFGSWNVSIPVWATRAIIVVTVGGVRLDRQSSSDNGTAVGQVQVALGTNVTQASSYDEFAPKSDASNRRVLGAADTIVVPLADRGQVRTLRIQGKKTSGNQNLYVDTYSFATLDVEFQEVAG